MPIRRLGRNFGNGDGIGSGDPLVSQGQRPCANDMMSSPPPSMSYVYSRPVALHSSQQNQYLHPHGPSQPRGQPYGGGEGRSDTSGPRLLYNGQNHNGRVGLNGMSMSPMSSSPQFSGRPSAAAAAAAAAGGGAPTHTTTTGTCTRMSSPSPMLSGDTPFGIRTPRATIPSANFAGSGVKGPKSQQHAATGSGTSGPDLSQPPSNGDTPSSWGYRQCNNAAARVQTRLLHVVGSPPADNSMKVSRHGGATPTESGSSPRSPAAQSVFPMTVSPSRSPPVISSSPRSPHVSPRALPAMAISTHGGNFNSQSSPPSSPIVTGEGPASLSSRTQPSFEGTATTGYASSYGNGYAPDTSHHQQVTSMDGSRSYETGAVDSGTYRSSTVDMSRSHSYTATLGDEETATYLSGTIASQTVQTVQTDGTGTYEQSFDSTYRTSRETYNTDDIDDGEETVGDDVDAKDFGGRLNRWRRGRQAKEDDESIPFDYAAFSDSKRPSQTRGESGSATSPPRSSKEILSPSPSGVSLRTADINARVARKERMDYQNTQQQHGYLAIILTLLQALILGGMMACGAAPLTINWSVGPYPDTLSEFGAKNPYLMIEMNQWWRFFTPQMLNTGVIHLLCNAYVQLETAAFYEREWGSRRWGVIYFCSAVGSTIVSSILDPDTIGVSSSGALMGIFGAKFAEVLTLTIFDTFYRRDGAAFQHLGGTLCSLVTVCLFCAAPLVDWSGHIGGLATGFFLGMVLFGKFIRKIHLKAAWQLLGLAIFIACLGTAINELVYHVAPSAATGDACAYYKSIFVNQEYDCTCQLGNIYASSLYTYGDDGYVDDALNDDDGDGDDDGGDGDGERDGEDANDEDRNDQQDNDKNEDEEGEDEDNERGEENGGDGEEE